MTSASFHISGYTPVNNMFVKINLTGNTRDSSQIINILGEIPSGPLALAGVRPRIRVSISALVIGIS